MSSSTVRAYIPTTVSAAAARWDDGTACAAGSSVYRVTADDRAGQTGKPDEEALEYAAFRRAADAAAGNRRGETAVVISADVPAGEITGGVLAADLPAAAVVSFHLGADLLWYDATEAGDILR
ncbi:DUF6912 family protein [Spelaeicoccus albus]|uniref:Uncharacterized protein n=1 Tax=Spelaeicoccus albus TaxID=1280376 RepID=A0A7Z0II08_9MICO|nr:hypothetical protein [Spelaeicoccus albus]NYI67972.1 hypothetical protein [Spelaeicoccus albus]